MARPIRNTPILFGEDAEEFIRRANTPLPLEERMRRRKEVQEGVAELMKFVEELNRNKENKNA